MTQAAPANSSSRFQTLLGFLNHDPMNATLLADAVEAALDEGALEPAKRLLDRYEAVAVLPDSLKNLNGLIALHRHDFSSAAAIFQDLLDRNSNGTLCFNLAWCQAMLGRYEAADIALTDAALADVPAAATLKVQTLHHLGRLEDALARGADLAGRHPDDQALMGALALVAIDAEDLDLARSYALRAGRSHEGLSTLGMLHLNENHVGEAIAFFDQAVAANPQSARGLLGRGLAAMTLGDLNQAADDIDMSAGIFKSHLGSWVAAGWVHFLKGDLAGSRARFERALSLDDTFAETHGGLAVLDIQEGDLEAAGRRTDIALRLDRQCFAGALARSLLLEQAGDAERAERVRNIALNAPIGTNGMTLARAMVMLGATRAKPN